jgi:hypothetical protein
MSNIQPDKLEKFQKLLEITNEGLTRKDFLDSFKTVVEQVLKLELKLIEKINQANKELSDNQNALKNATQADLRGLATRFEQSINSALKEQANGMNFIRDKVRNMKNGLDGKDGINGQDGRPGMDADENKIIQEVLKKIDLPELEIEKIKGLKETLDRLETLGQQRRKGGGGTSALGIANAAKYFVKTEKPSGTINGVNKAFTVSKPIMAVLSFSLNGEFIAQLPNYTISNKTVTFSEAIPSAYATKDFEIVYI